MVFAQFDKCDSLLQYLCVCVETPLAEYFYFVNAMLLLLLSIHCCVSFTHQFAWFRMSKAASQVTVKQGPSAGGKSSGSERRHSQGECCRIMESKSTREYLFSFQVLSIMTSPFIRQIHERFWWRWQVDLLPAIDTHCLAARRHQFYHLIICSSQRLRGADIKPLKCRLDSATFPTQIRTKQMDSQGKARFFRHQWKRGALDNQGTEHAWFRWWGIWDALPAINFIFE